MKKVGYILLMSLITITAAWGQNVTRNINKGNKLYNDKKYTDAEIQYRVALLKNPKSFEASYNLGNTMFRQKKYSEAIEKYNYAAAQPMFDKNKIAAAFHNVGNSYLADKKLEDAIKAYKTSLKLNPRDNETRYNLALAMKLLKDQNKNNKNKDMNKDKKDQNKKDQKKDQQQQQQQQQDQNKDNQDKQNQQQPQPQKGQMSKEQAQQILDALSQDEKGAQEKARKVQAKTPKKSDKDW